MQLSKLNKAVLRQLGGGAEAKQYAIDAANHGGNSGFFGFTYYADTVKFFEKNKKEIIDTLAEESASCGQHVSSTLSFWRSLAGVKEPLLVLALGKTHEEYDTVANALAWYALEHCGNALQDMQETV